MREPWQCVMNKPEHGGHVSMRPLNRLFNARNGIRLWQWNVEMPALLCSSKENESDRVRRSSTPGRRERSNLGALEA